MQPAAEAMRPIQIRPRKRGRVDRALLAALVGLLWVGFAAASRAQAPGGEDPRLTPRERADPLEPWSLEPVPGQLPAIPPPAPADTTGGRAAAGAPPPAGGVQTPAVPADSSEVIAVVRLRAVLVGRADQAERLAELLRGGASLESAQRAVGGVKIDEKTRDLPLEELEPALRAEVEALEPGGWTGVRPWRGRSAFFQVVAKEDRRRSTIPKLGEGLDEQEQARLATLRHPMPVRAPKLENTDAGRDYQPAAVVTQQRAEYPSSATTAGEVTVEVQIGLADNVLDVRVVESTDRVFEPASTVAAQRSIYQSARRSGVPEQGTVRLKFQFAAPVDDQAR